MDSKHYSLFHSTITLIATSLLMLETDQLGIFVLYKEHFFLCLISRCDNFLNSYRQDVDQVVFYQVSIELYCHLQWPMNTIRPLKDNSLISLMESSYIR